MFLEVGDLGYSAWSGSTTTAATNADIKSSLGLGVVRFEEEPELPEISTYDYEYRVNTEVITSVFVSGGQSDPYNPTSVNFEINGQIYTVSNVYYPLGDGQLVWVKWTTPSEPQEMVINVTVNKGITSKSTINVNIVDLNENPPPNPVADDRNDDFKHSSVPNRNCVNRLEWSVWSPYWQSNWQWVSNWHWIQTPCDDFCLDGCLGGHGYWVDYGYWRDFGYWKFNLNSFYAEIFASMSIVCDEKNPTAQGDIMKSGYGINQYVKSNSISNQSTQITDVQTAVSYFPEFNYETYWRLLEETNHENFEFQKNVYSTFKNRTHFTPIYFPDGNYTVNTWVADLWTPAGMLSANLSDALIIKGNVWEDWHIGPNNIY